MGGAVVTRVGSHHQMQTIINRAVKNRADLTEVQNQISTGQEAEKFSDIPQHLPRLINLQNDVSKIDTYTQGIDVVGSRLQVVSSAMERMQERMSDFQQKIVQARNPGNEIGGIEIVAASHKKGMETALNSQLSGFYLFGGIEISKPPVLIDAATDNLVGYQAATYYQGSDIGLKASADDQSTFDYGVKANDAWAQSFFIAIQQVIDNPADDAQLGLALDNMNVALDQMAIGMAKVGHQMKSFEDVKSNLEVNSLNYGIQIADIQSADVALAMARNAELQTLLEASFMMVGSLQGMNLMNYVKIS